MIMLIEELMMQVKDGSILASARPASADSVFLDRIKQFEQAYKMRWFEFLERYDQHELRDASDEQRIDFAEWYMLCQRFSEQLEEGINIFASPPLTDSSVFENEGPSNRAFLLC
jgi:hypothetical protein